MSVRKSKYQFIAQELSTRIRAGTYPLNQPIPTQNELATEFKTSRVTIQQAVNILVNSGLLYSVRGSGTYIRKSALQISKLDAMGDEYHGATYKLRNRGAVTSKLLSFATRFPTQDEQDSLLLAATDPIYEISRVRYLDKQPIALEHTIMPTAAVPNLTRKILMNSIYRYIEHDLHHRIGSSYRTVEADLATKQDQAELQLPIHEAVLVVNQVVYFDNGVPFELSSSRHPRKRGHVIIVNQKNTKGYE